MMKATAYILALAGFAGLVSAPIAAQGRLGLLDRGEYVCSLPGDATGRAWVEQEGHGFTITGGSSYETPRGAGTYLMEGKQVIFTRGPMKGMKLMQLGSGLLQEIGKDGKLGRLRCHRAGPAPD
ncbi:elongation factor P [Qipengyuania sp. 6B39]|uniref:elongation factor P n=1 Tax=Qipengyuania proteolytica TaxID=2867239 RepID=UPI001C89BE82|nr:elongation factor P [Qipengyuania proteolytica]MBX7495919.1 elongation factor P [Qipengyuania proteolytica]